jgi:hypothetical protein
LNNYPQLHGGYANEDRIECPYCHNKFRWLRAFIVDRNKKYYEVCCSDCRKKYRPDLK